MRDSTRSDLHHDEHIENAEARRYRNKEIAQLGAAVILQAIEDRATHWFSSSYSRQAFEFWCAVGGLDPGRVKRKAMAAMKR